MGKFGDLCEGGAGAGKGEQPMLYCRSTPIDVLDEAAKVLLSASYFGVAVIAPKSCSDVKSNEITGGPRNHLKDKNAVRTQVVIHETRAVALLSVGELTNSPNVLFDVGNSAYR